ncbi:MAG: RNase adapter RapZ [Burkholderiales bacterium]|nr:RNase adapter RapZ [Burkholderiales bacterium]
MLLVIISGLSGSGKSVALNVLEDASFYCVDNLPAALLADTVAFLGDAGYGRVAVSIDARSGPALAALPDSVRALKQSGVDVRLLFLDAKSETLIKRFSETRRRHPLADGRTLEESIAREREALAAVGELGHHIDTSDVTPNTLRSWVKDLVEVDRSGTTLLFESFGFKQGVPLDADLVFDVRCLPNPFYDPKLRPLTGLDAEVVAFLDGLPDARAMAADIGDFIARWLPAFQRDNRAYLTVALGCTGGQHRSVYFVERLAARFRADAPVLVRHRQLARGEPA